MLDILQTIHDEYIPVGRGTDRLTGEDTVEVLEKVFFGGDQLTEERVTNGRDARSDGDKEFERLQGVIPKVEDWHASRILYQVKKLMLYLLAEHITFTFFLASVNKVTHTCMMVLGRGWVLVCHRSSHSVSEQRYLKINYYALQCTI